MQVRARTRAEWRRWLAKHHDKADDVWLIYAKSGSGKPSVKYAEAVEEALCFGWIDTTIRSIDENEYMQRFTPRRPGSNWSAINRERFARMVAEGKMTPAGLAKGPSDDKPPAVHHYNRGDAVPDYYQAALNRNAKAKKFFESLPPSQKRMFVHYVDSAKREETRARRLAKMMEKLEKGEKITMQ